LKVSGEVSQYISKPEEPMLYEITIPQFIRILRNLNVLLDKAKDHAEKRKYDVGNVLNARLSPDQFNFIRQVQISCETAQTAAARLSGQEPPKIQDSEQTIDELKLRIKNTVEYLMSIKPEQFIGAEKRIVPIPWLPGKGMPGKEFTLLMAIPNLYFHFTTAYSILRHNGVELIKSDFLGPLEFKTL
jgi:hypothetical protein